MRMCSKCGLNERLSYHNYCRSCHCERQKKYYRDNPGIRRQQYKDRKKEIREFIVAEKNKPCLDCGKSYPYYVMDFDHVRGKKKFLLSVSASKSRSIESLKTEIAKCDVVCSNCHRIRTFTRLLPDGVISNIPGSEPEDSRCES